MYSAPDPIRSTADSKWVRQHLRILEVDVSQDPRTVIASSPMHYRQVLSVFLVILCIAIDGFDVFSIAFAAPLIASTWNTSPAGLGIVLSMELVGMGLGSYLVGLSADRLGRRVAIIGSLVITASGMWFASISTDIQALALSRLYTGLGIGGLLVAGSALISESANERRRDMAVALMVAGYPLGVAIGGIVAAQVLAHTGRWQTIFEVGAIATSVLLIPICLLLPESVSFLSQAHSKKVTARLNCVLALYGKPQIPMTIQSDINALSRRRMQLATSGISALSLTLMLAFFLHMMTFYFLMKWIPKLVVDLGYTPSAASMVMVWANVAGTIGSLFMSMLALKYPLRALVVGGMMSGGAAVIMFGQHQGGFLALTITASIAGFFATGATAGFYALLARSFSSRVRAGSTGFVIGLGRSGAAAGPIAAGLLFTLGWPLSVVAAILGAAGLFAAAVIYRTGSIKSSLQKD